MLSTSHTIISLPFAFVSGNPLVIFIGAFITHLVCDMMLHWNIYPQNYKKYPFVLVGIDVFAGLIVTYLLLGIDMFTIPVLTAIAGGNAPDVLHTFWGFLKKGTQKRMPKFVHTWFAFHEKLQWETESPLAGGLSQVLMGGAAFLLTLLLR